MTSSFTPRLLRDAAVSADEPQAVVESFLAALAAADFSRAGDLLAEDVVYINVGMPAVHGRRRTMAFLRPLGRPGMSFEVYLHAIAADGPTVLTDRTDVLVFGALRWQFWVAGRFDVQDGKISYWRDSFDYLDVLRGLLRGVVGLAVPRLRPPAPASAATQPGRH